MRRRSCTLFCLFFLSALMCLQRSMRICDMWYSPMLSSKLHGFPPFIELFLLSKLVFKRLDIEGLFHLLLRQSLDEKSGLRRPFSSRQRKRDGFFFHLWILGEFDWGNSSDPRKRGSELFPQSIFPIICNYEKKRVLHSL